MKVQSISLDDCIIFGGYKNKKGYKQKELVEIFGLSKASVCRIINNKAWQ